MRIAVVMLGSFDLKLRGFLAAVVLATSLGSIGRQAQGASPALKVIAFYTGMKDEPAHISFVQEANRWFAEAVRQSNFTYTSTTNWAELSDQDLAKYQVVLFLDTRPEDPRQRAA